MLEGNDYTEMYAAMKIGERVVLDLTFSFEPGQMYATVREGDEGTIIAAHPDNEELDNEHKLWLVSFFRELRGTDGYHYNLWFRANRLGLIA